MATELVAGTSQLRLISLYTQRSKQPSTSIIRKLFQLATQRRGALVIRYISDRCPRGDHAKPCIEGGEFSQERLEGRFSEPSFLLTRRILEWLQTVQNKQGSTMCNKLGQSFALLPCRSEPRVWVAKPGESRIEKFIGGRGAPTRTLSVEGPTKDQLC